jgi:formylglycine-generating enzyme
MTAHRKALLVAALSLSCSSEIDPSPDKIPAASQPLTRCPQELPGPSLVFIPHPTSPFCIDKTEVSQTHYAQFLADSGDKKALQPARCGANTTFQPVQATHLDMNGCDGEKVYVYDPQKRGDYPIACIDWCDAATYCAWAGKRLCGGVDGGGLDVEKELLTGQWGYVCSQGGKTAYSYGDSYQKDLCATVENPGTDVVTVTSKPECAGNVAPFSEVQNLSGNLMEFEDACENSALCRHRGLLDKSNTERSKCGEFVTAGIGHHAAYLGFRCCYQ